MGNEYFIGTDIVSVPRIAGVIKRHPERFPRHTYSQQEIDYCESMPVPSLHYAGRFAAKEAIKKAVLSSGQIENIPLNQIEITRGEEGEPIASVKGLDKSEWICKVSISHTEEFATAMALLSRT